MEAVGALFRILEFLVDALGLLDLVSPWHWWKKWDETANPVALVLAVFSAVATVVLVGVVLMAMLGRL
jgi:hypothetical protein